MFKKLAGGVLFIAGCVMVWQFVSLRSFNNLGSVLSEVDSVSLEDRVAILERRVAVLERQTRKSTSISTQKEAFVRLLDGTVASGSWSAVSGSEFWLDLSLHGNVTKVTWEGWLEVKDSNGVAYARLYDITNNRAVDFSEVGVMGQQKASFYSKPLAIWRGQNQYRIELKSSTGYPVSISDSRLRIVIQ